jgi:dolichol-phosphate mannosyltransferase
VTSLINDSAPRPADGSVELSIIAPAHNEQENIAGLVADVEQAMADSGLRFELIVVDDGSTDQTRRRLIEQMAGRPWLRVFAMTQTPPGRGNGQSAAFHAGLRRAAAPLIALMDADRQNDPADLPAMVQRLRDEQVDMVQGDRSHARQDNFIRRQSSAVGRAFRRMVLGDTIRDTGCSLRVFRREPALLLPLQYKGLHRFIPIYFRMAGYQVVQMQVNHRPRAAGEAKYGIWNRALPGLIDLLAVRWMRSRLRPTTCRAVEASPEPGP